MIYVSAAQLALVAGICICAGISDIRSGKVRNSVLASASAAAAALTLIYFFACSHDDWLLYLENAGIVAAAALLGYAARIWAGGDCKLMLFFAIAYPVLFCFEYNGSRLTLWLFLMISLSAGFIYVVAESVTGMIRGRAKPDRAVMIPTLKAGGWVFLKSFLFVTALNLSYTAFVQPYIDLHPIVYALLSVAMVYGFNLVKPFGRLGVVICLALYDTVMTVVTGKLVLMMYWKTYILVIAFMLIRVFVSGFNYEKIKVSDVSEGMVLARDESVYMNSFSYDGLPGVSDETLRSRLTAQQAESVRKWGRSRYGKDELRIVRKLPFALFLGIGMLIYSAMGVLRFCDLL